LDRLFNRAIAAGKAVLGATALDIGQCRRSIVILRRPVESPDATHPSPLSRQARKQETYDAIIRAAATLFARYGFAATSLDQIAAHIGLTRGAVYAHFKNKRDLIDAVTRATTVGFAEAPFTDPDLEPRARMRRFAKEVLAIASVATKEQFLLDSETFLYMLRDDEMGAEEAIEQRAVHQAYAAMLETTLAARGERLTVPADEFVGLVFGIVRGLVLENARLPGAVSQATIEHAFDALASLIKRSE
jgi:AcrR family transcriptional regulator